MQLVGAGQSVVIYLKMVFAGVFASAVWMHTNSTWHTRTAGQRALPIVTWEWF